MSRDCVFLSFNVEFEKQLLFLFIMSDVIVYNVNDYDVYNVDEIVFAVDFAFKIGKKMKT